MSHATLTLLICVSSFAQLFEQRELSTRPTTQPTGIAVDAVPQVQTFIQGQIVDEMGRGVAEVDIVVAKVADAGTTGKTRSNSFGDFEFKISGAHPGKFQLTATKNGFVDGALEFEIVEDDLEPFVDVTLKGSLVLAGDVVEFSALRPIGRAEVRLATMYRSDATKTDDAGRFEFKNLIPGPVELSVQAEGFGKRLLNIRTVEITPAVRVTLKPERILHLTIVDDESKPVAGAAVEMEITQRPSDLAGTWEKDAPRDIDSQASSLQDYRSGNGDEEGRLTVRGLPYETRQAIVRVTHKDFVSTSRFDHVVTFDEDEAETRHTVHLQPAALIKGTIKQADSGLAVNGARIDIGERRDYSTPHSFSNIAGEYRIDSLAPGLSVVTVSAAGFAPQIKSVVTQPRQSAELHFEMGPGRSISGRVVDEKGQPLRGANIEALKWLNYETLGLATLSDAEGNFTIANAPLEEFRMNIYTAGHRSLPDQVISVDRNRYQFELGRLSEEELAAAAPTRLAKVGDLCPVLKLTTLKGAKIDETTSKGKLILLDFWATWCPPCVADLPEVKRVYDNFGKRDDFMLVGVSSDFERATLEKFIEVRQLAWHQVFGPDSGAEELSAAMGVTAIPCTILIGKDGKFIAVDLPAKELHDTIEAALKVGSE